MDQCNINLQCWPHAFPGLTRINLLCDYFDWIAQHIGQRMWCARRRVWMGNKNASSPHRQNCEEQNEAQLFKPHTYRTSNLPNSRPGVTPAGEQEPVHSVALLQSVQDALVSGGGAKVHSFFDCTTLLVEQRAINRVLAISLPCMRN